MENLEPDMNFTSGEIDPNQLGFPNVTESGFSLAGAPHGIVSASMETDDASGSASNTASAQNTAPQQIYTEGLGLDYSSNISMALESDLPQGSGPTGMPTFLTLQQVGSFAGMPHVDQLGQVATVESGQHHQQSPQEEHLNLTQSLELSHAGLAHLYTMPTSNSHLDMASKQSMTTLLSGPVLTLTSAAVTSPSPQQLQYTLPQRSTSSLADVSASFLQSLQNARPTNHLVLDQSSFAGGQQQVRQSQNTLPSVAGMLPPKNSSSPTTHSKLLIPPSNAVNFPHQSHQPVALYPSESTDSSSPLMDQSQTIAYTDSNQSSISYIPTAGGQYSAELNPSLGVGASGVGYPTHNQITTASSSPSNIRCSKPQHTSAAQRQGSRLAASGLSQLLISGAIPQGSELLHQIKNQLQNQGINLPNIESVLNSMIAKSTKGTNNESLGTQRESVSGPFPEGNIPQVSPSAPVQLSIIAPNAQPNFVIQDVGKVTSQVAYEEVPASLPVVTQSQALPVQLPHSRGADAKNEPEMMIYHDKMTRKNILVPIGPPNVTAGRNMAPSPMFLDENVAGISNSRKMSQSHTAEASSSDQHVGINVSEFLNPLPRPRVSVSTPMMTTKPSRTLDSPPDDMVSSTTQDIREDLPPLHEILSPQHHFNSSFSTLQTNHLLDTLATSRGSLTDYNVQSASQSVCSALLPQSSFHHTGVASGADIMQYEPISDSEEGEISTTCPVTPAANHSAEQEETSGAEGLDDDDEDDDDDDDEYEETEEDDVGSSEQEDKAPRHYHSIGGAGKSMLNVGSQIMSYSQQAAIVIQPQNAQNPVHFNALQSPQPQLLSDQNMVRTVTDGVPQSCPTSHPGYTMPFKKVEVQFLNSGQVNRPSQRGGQSEGQHHHPTTVCSLPAPVSIDNSQGTACSVSLDQIGLKCDANVSRHSDDLCASLSNPTKEMLTKTMEHHGVGMEVVNQVLRDVGPPLTDPNSQVRMVEHSMQGSLGDGCDEPPQQLLPVPHMMEEGEEDESDLEEEAKDNEVEEMLGDGDFSKENYKQKLDISVQVDDAQCIMVDGLKKWTCRLCPKAYSSKHNLVTHILGHNGIKPHCCMICGKYFKQQSHLHTHLLTHRKIKPHVCKICGRGFTQASHAKRHMAIHMETRPHICNVCDRGFVYPSELKLHTEKHHQGKQSVCADCDETFPSVKKLKNHTQVAHKDLTALSCKQCGKSFSYPSQLRDHMLKHDGKRPFICGECGVDFMKEHHLRAHQFTHTGLRPFVCNVCGRAFNQKANMQRHMVVHDKDRKYECDVCRRTFTQAQVLRAHMVTHADHKPHQCQICGKEFSRLHNLNGHMHMHSGEKPHSCFCGASFTLKSNLNRHKKDKHNISGEGERTTEEEAAQILNEMSTRKLPVDSAPEDSLDGSGNDGSTPKKKRKSVPRKSLKEEQRQEVEEDIADVWKTSQQDSRDEDEEEEEDDEEQEDEEEGNVEKQDALDTTTDISNMEFISRFVNLNGPEKMRYDGNSFTDNPTPSPLISPCTTSTPSNRGRNSSRGGRGSPRGRKVMTSTPVEGTLKMSIKRSQNQASTSGQSSAGKSRSAAAISRSGRRCKKVSYMDEAGSLSDDETVVTANTTDVNVGLNGREHDPDWETVNKELPSKVTVGKGGRSIKRKKGRVRGGKVVPGEGDTGEANVKQDSNINGAMTADVNQSLPAKHNGFIMEASLVNQESLNVPAHTVSSGYEPLKWDLYHRPKSDIILPPKRRVSEIEKEAALLSQMSTELPSSVAS